MKNNSISLLYEKNIINIYLENNKLYLIFLGDKINNNIFLKSLEVMELFYEVCKTKNIKFYFIANLSLLKLQYYPLFISYIPQIIVFLKKYTEFYKNYKYGTIFITESLISQEFAKYILSLYKPTRPYKFVLTNENIDFSFD